MKFAVCFPSLVLGLSNLASVVPSPFKPEWVQAYEVGDGQFVRHLWRYRFALPIVFKFSAYKLNYSLEPSLFFRPETVDEVYPLLLLPSLSQFNNPFKNVPKEYFTFADLPIDVDYVVAEIKAADQEGRGINVRRLAERYSLLQTMVTIEDLVKDGKALGDELSEKVKAGLDDLASSIYESSTLNYAHYFYFSIQDAIPGDMLFEKLTGNPEKWSLMQPKMKERDRFRLYHSLSSRKNFYVSITNLSLVAELMAEFSHVPLGLGLARNLPVDFFLDFPHDKLLRFVELQVLVNPDNKEPSAGFGEHFRSEVETITNFLISQEFKGLRDDPITVGCSKAMRLFVARRILAKAKAEENEDLDMEDALFTSRNVPLHDIRAGIKNGLIEDTNFTLNHVLALTALQSPQSTSREGDEEQVEVDMLALSLICLDDQEVMLPERLKLKMNPKLTFTEYMLPIWEGALRSRHGKLAVKLAKRLPESAFQAKNYCPQIALLDDSHIQEILIYHPACLVEIVKLNGLRTYQLDDFTDSSGLISDQAAAQINHICNHLVTETVGEEEIALSAMQENLFQLRPSFYFSPLFITNKGAADFKHLSIELLREVIHGSAWLKPLIMDVAVDCLKYTKPYGSHHQYLKMRHLVFEEFPAAIQDINQLVSYLKEVISHLGPPPSREMEVDVPGEKRHPLAFELVSMKEHLTRILGNRSLIYLDTSSVEALRPILETFGATDIMDLYS